MRIGVVGVGGRMGRLLAEEVVAGGFTLSGGTERAGSMPILPTTALSAVKSRRLGCPPFCTASTY